LVGTLLDKRQVAYFIGQNMPASGGAQGDKAELLPGMHEELLLQFATGAHLFLQTRVAKMQANASFGKERVVLLEVERER
jgi:hypothetical protein